MDSRPAERLDAAFGETLAQLADQFPKLSLRWTVSADSPVAAPFRNRFPDRCARIDEHSSSELVTTAETAGPAAPVLVIASASTFVGAWYPAIRASLAPQRANVKLVATSGVHSVDAADEPGVFDDLALMRTLPGMTVLEPADAPTARSTARALVGMDGPAYVRLAGGPQPTVTNGELELGRATELRPGTDLTLIAVGPLVARALVVATSLGRVGVRARVLDLGCLKPFDEKAVLRAARETGALLTLENQYISTGVGALISAATAENCPVPVRRLGILDLDGGPADGRVGSERPELSEERALQEAWELLRLKGKVQ